MRKFLQIIGVIALIAFGCICLGIGFLIYQGGILDRQSHAYVDQAVPAIASSWNQTTFLADASPRLQASLKPGALENFFDQMALLGPLTHYDGSKGSSLMSTFNGVSKITASYTATGRFKNGKAVIRIFLVKQHGNWMIDGFHVDPATNVAPSNQE